MNRDDLQRISTGLRDRLRLVCRSAGLSVGEEVGGWETPQSSESSLGFGDVDLDAVCALCGRVLPEGGSALGLQQPPPRFCPLTVPEVQRLLPDGYGMSTNARHHQATRSTSSTSGAPVTDAIGPEAATHPACWLLW